MSTRTYEIAIIGGGIIGCATGMALSRRAKTSIIILEAEKKLAAHQTGNNSGVVHSGLYYKPGSLKARNCVTGREIMYRFCKENGVDFDRCGKIVIATSRDEIPRLDELERRGRANGLKGLKRLSADQIKEYEPHASGLEGLYVPETGIVDYEQVTQKFVEIVKKRGGDVILETKVLSCRQDASDMVLSTTKGDFKTRNLINCAGLQSDRVARMCGAHPGLKIIPFRGEYYKLKPEKSHLVKNLIYPVPDPAFPFLGVHFTRMINGSVEAGPNAVLAFKREGYTKGSISIKDTFEILTYKGFFILISRFWKMGMGEIVRSYSKPAFVRALRKLVPEVCSKDVSQGGVGVRAQALEPDGTLVDDFRIIQTKKMIHVLNAPSPAATAAISIGEYIAALADKQFI